MLLYGKLNVFLFSSHRPLWKGVSVSGKTGLFDPSNVVAYLGSDLPSSSFMRTDSTRTSSRRKLRSEMISAPQGDLKHTGHVGLDGAYFGDLSFLSGAKVVHLQFSLNCFTYILPPLFSMAVFPLKLWRPTVPIKT